MEQEQHRVLADADIEFGNPDFEEHPCLDPDPQAAEREAEVVVLFSLRHQHPCGSLGSCGYPCGLRPLALRLPCGLRSLCVGNLISPSYILFGDLVS